VRRDPARRMHRFYALRLAPDLLGGWALLREWGRIGSPGRVRSDSFADAAGARAALERLARRKRRKGYA
jgi:predicted DNA-binding WGR domain protein